MNKIVLLDVEKRGGSNRDFIANLLYGLGLVEYSKSERPLIVDIVKLFLKNRKKPLRYREIVEELNSSDVDKRSHIVKICRKLSSVGILDEMAVIPADKKRWERAYKYAGFSNAVKTVKRRSEDILEQLEQLSEKVDK